MKKVVVGVLVVVVGLMCAVGAVVAKEQQAGKGLAAVERAAKAKKYLFIFFYGDDADQAAPMRPIFNKAVDNLSQKPIRIEINVTDPAEAGIVDKYGVRGAPMPLTLAIAPNGGHHRRLPRPFTEEQITTLLVTLVLRHR